MNIRNFTRNDLNIITSEGTIPLNAENKNEPAEAITSKHLVASVELEEGSRVPILRRTYIVKNLPDKVEGTYLIVPHLVAQALPNRDDLLTVQSIFVNRKPVGVTAFYALNYKE